MLPYTRPGRMSRQRSRVSNYGRPHCLEEEFHEEDAALRPSYPASQGWYARLPGLQEPANYGTKFETVIYIDHSLKFCAVVSLLFIYEEQVKSGYRLPLHPFALRFFEHYQMAPGQLVPNGWRKLAGLKYLVQNSGYKPDATDFMRVFFKICFVKGVANCPGWYYIHSRQRLLKGGLKSNKGWHSRYFFVGRLDKGELPFDKVWNPFCKDFKNPGKPTPNNQTKHILSHIKLRGGLCIDEPLSDEQLEWAKIIPPKPIPAGFLIPPPPAIPSMSSAETVPLEMAPGSGKSQQGGFLGVLQKAKGKRKEKQPSVEFSPALKKTRVTPPEHSPRILDQVSIDDDPIFRPRWTLRRDDLGMPDSQVSEHHLLHGILPRDKEIATLEKRLERVKRRAAEEVTKARDQGIRDFLDGNAGEEWLKKRTDDGLEIYEMGFMKAKEMFVERFPDMPLDDFVMPAVVSPYGETAMPSEAGDAAASHLPGEGNHLGQRIRLEIQFKNHTIVGAAGVREPGGVSEAVATRDADVGDNVWNTINWSLAHLLKHQEAVSKLRDELAKTTDGDVPRESHLPQMAYLDACMKETIRLRPPGPFLVTHRVVQACKS
ncbi:hypothetical protein RJ640_026428 [Escallonia rubra]|uniref:Transposase (putative) gypsy type domain-containing protein n=1 Tax=Escallonia rubra TaxID=112253 RepID=A0AA88RUS0_9ASTE|nr:hypothetical protein RJ640_026428 [Escallonia rubra]